MVQASDETKALSLRKFTESDLPVLTPIMREAFDEDSAIHLNGAKGGPPRLRQRGFSKEMVPPSEGHSLRDNVRGTADWGGEPLDPFRREQFPRLPFPRSCL